VYNGRYVIQQISVLLHQIQTGRVMIDLQTASKVIVSFAVNQRLSPALKLTSI
jgi:hypothetical protein